MLDEVLTTQESADLLKMKRRTLYGWLREGRILARRVLKEWRIPKTALLAFLKGDGGKEAQG